MKLDFKFNEPALISHLKIRKEGSEKHDLAIDIKCAGVVTSGLLYQVLGCAKSKAAHFWDDVTDEKRASFGGIVEIICNSDFENCDVSINAKRFLGCTVHKFRLKPEAGHMLKVSCMVSISNLTDEEAGFLCEIYRETATVTINGEPDMIDDGKG